MEELLTFVAKSLVDHPDQVRVQKTEGPEGIILELNVAEEDMGKVIGKQGRIAKAIRSVVKAATPKDGTHVFVEIQRPLEELAEDEIPEADEEEDPEA
ncbi:MAG: KH domain-containing protein [Clostridia bacterium]|nr:KH domain-containing protein [Clostridia bacterium]